MNCLICQNNEATTHKTFGILPCRSCLEHQRGLSKVRQPTELTTDSIRQQRREFKADIIQPWRSGELSKEYIETYGDQHIKTDSGEMKKAKYTWEDQNYYRK